jgi:hypothetical protein
MLPAQADRYAVGTDRIAIAARVTRFLPKPTAARSAPIA